MATFLSSKSVGLLLSSSLALAVVLSGCGTKEITATNSQVVTSPVLAEQSSKDDFSFPSTLPKLSDGKKLFFEKCASFPKQALSYSYVQNAKPIDQYLALAHGDVGCGKDMSRDQRWAVVFYTRYLAGETNITRADIKDIFGANCAVCHGNRGHADGPLYTGHGSHKLGMAPRKNLFYPPPANFTDYGRMYNRSNTWLAQLISEGSYPSAMPPWKGWKNPVKGYEFNEVLISDLVKYVRTFSYNNDLPVAEQKNPPKTLSLKLSPQLSQVPSAKKRSAQVN